MEEDILSLKTRYIDYSIHLCNSGLFFSIERQESILDRFLYSEDLGYKIENVLFVISSYPEIKILYNASSYNSWKKYDVDIIVFLKGELSYRNNEISFIDDLTKSNIKVFISTLMTSFAKLNQDLDGFQSTMKVQRHFYEGKFGKIIKID